MLWMKSLHIIFMVTWFAGLFYLPRLYVYHAETKDKISNDRFKVMERKLFYGIMTPGGILTIFFGLLLIYNYKFCNKDNMFLPCPLDKESTLVAVCSAT